MVAVAAVKDDRKAPAAPKYSQSALVSHFKLAETERNTFEILVDDDTPQEILLRDEYWTLVSEQLTNRDLIYVSPKNGRWLCILRVIFADRKTRQAQVVLLQKWDLPAPKISLNFGLPPGAEIRYIDPRDKYAVFRNGALLRDGFVDSAAAQEHVRTNPHLFQ